MSLPKGCVLACRGCRYRGLTADESAQKKSEWVHECFESMPPESIQPLILPPKDQRLNYRDKTCLHAEWSAHSGRWNFGLLGRDKELIPIPECPVHTPSVRKTFEMLSTFLPNLPLHAVAVQGELLVLVLKSRPFPGLENLDWKKVSEVGSRVRGVYAHFFPSAGRKIFSSKDWVHLWGSERGEVKFQDLQFSYPPQAFQQAHLGLYRSALAEVENYFELAPGDAVLDLYSGLGVSLQLWKNARAEVCAVELQGDAVKMSQRNAPGATVYQGRVSDRLPQLSEWIRNIRKVRSDLKICAFINPPRSGIEPEVLEWLRLEAIPDRVAYLSCNARTAARDWKILMTQDEPKTGNYRFEWLQPYDFFPQTDHVEVLGLAKLSEKSIEGRPK